MGEGKSWRGHSGTRAPRRQGIQYLIKLPREGAEGVARAPHLDVGADLERRAEHREIELRLEGPRAGGIEADGRVAKVGAEEVAFGVVPLQHGRRLRAPVRRRQRRRHALERRPAAPAELGRKGARALDAVLVGRVEQRRRVGREELRAAAAVDGRPAVALLVAPVRLLRQQRIALADRVRRYRARAPRVEPARLHARREDGQRGLAGVLEPADHLAAEGRDGRGPARSGTWPTRSASG